MKGKTSIVAITFLFLTAGFAGASQTANFAAEHIAATDDIAVQGSHALISLTGVQDLAASWQGAGASARLHIQGEDLDEFEGGVVSEEATPVEQTVSFNEWSLEGGEWSPDYQVLIGTTGDQIAQVSFVSPEGDARNSDAEPSYAQLDRFFNDVTAVEFNPSNSIEWTATEISRLRITGDFTVTAWAADMLIADGESDTELFHSGARETSRDGAEAAESVAYTNELRINNLYVTDGWLEIDVHHVGTQHVFTDNAVVSTTGAIQAANAILHDGGDALAEGDLTASEAVDFELTPSSDGLAITPLASEAWNFAGVPIFDASGNPVDASQLAILVADPSEGHWPLWAQVTSWIGLAVVLAATFELTGVAPLGRAQFYLATYRYDHVRARSHWKWFPTAIRARMYFNAALAAAGREDHQAALEYATGVPDGSRWSKPARFVGIQSMAALGNDTAAEFALHDLAQSDRRYQVMATENPFLRHLVQ